MPQQSSLVPLERTYVPVGRIHGGPLPPPAQAENDEQLIELWLRTKSEATAANYRINIIHFTAWIDKPLPLVAMKDVLDYRDHVASVEIGSQQKRRPLAESTRAWKLSIVKSLLTFGQKIGYLAFNVGAAVTLPRYADRLAERILPEAQLHRMIALEPSARNRVLIRLAYATGGRVSEIAALRTRNVQPRTDLRTGREAAQITVFGKGGKTRAIPFSPETWTELRELVRWEDPDAPLFRSRKGGGHLSRSQILRIVRTAALRAGIALQVSPHWLRHAHASHALDRGAPLPLVRDTLGHASIATTNKYAHARPGESSSRFLGI